MDTISDLISTIDSLAEPDRADAMLTLERILILPQGERELALGLLALDLVEFAAVDAGEASGRPQPVRPVPVAAVA